MADKINEDQDQPRIIDSATGGPLSKSRRRFLAHSGMYTAGLVGSALLGACSDDKNVALAQDDDNNGGVDPNNPDIVDLRNAPSDAAVLQFALNLEYLEAEYYLQAVTGAGLSDNDNNDGDMAGGQVTTFDNPQVNFGDGMIERYAAEIAADELHHVQFLRGQLQEAGAGIAAPRINLRSSFTAAARTALQCAGVTPPDDFQFNPFQNDLTFLLGAFIFEDVGVSAYKGGAQFIRNREFLTAAAGILSVEGYHAGIVRTILTARQDETALTVNGTDLTVAQVVNAISAARDNLDGPDDIDQGITNTQYNTVTLNGTDYDSSNIVPTNMSGITFSRSPAQVHNIVYLTQNMVGPQMGSVPDVAFFPEGTNIPANRDLQNSGDQTDSGECTLDDDGAMDDGNDSMSGGM